ncbi:GAF domain-containing sensor histidine kinase [Marinagarivorans algicola]|uniref:GAF domain-containing sensor histidine kinase n=1 Tax=Marinagarivorans algicola TaxID=1513270 RepID=UPI0006B403A3|nr:GAF domain-containing sensor histidine kinase [Marinagarivorans algicola]
MKSAPLHKNEQQRLLTLKHYEVLDTEAESMFDDLTDLASRICGAPISLVSLVDTDRQWFKSRVGIDATQTDRSIAFCSHAILQDDIFEIPNALDDERFRDNPLVASAPAIRFYAGAPLVAPDGSPIGTLCVIDDKPHQLTEDQKQALRILSRQVITQLELRLTNRQLKRTAKEREHFFTLLAHDLRSPFNAILGLSERLANTADTLTPQRIIKSAYGILSSSIRAFTLLEELLQWSQLQIDQKQLTINEEQLRPLASQSIDFLSDAISLKKITIDNTIARSLLVLADGTLVKTVLRNLLSNAVKFSPEKGTITLCATESEKTIKVSVQNTGEPMSPRAAQQLFKSAVDSTQGTQGEEGCGLGLMLCQQFIDRQGGRIWLDTHFTAGTKICFTLPSAAPLAWH